MHKSDIRITLSQKLERTAADKSHTRSFVQLGKEPYRKVSVYKHRCSATFVSPSSSPLTRYPTPTIFCPFTTASHLAVFFEAG